MTDRAAFIERIWYYDLWWRMNWPYVGPGTVIYGWSV